MTHHESIDAVVIGRNEGDRLKTCLQSLQGKVRRIVYVDSGSSDDSVSVARAMGADVVELNMRQPFTAARARNAGLNQLDDTTAFVQFVDGDCEVVSGWIDSASAYLSANPNVAVACGRRRERFPDASFFNRLCDQEWDTPLGQTKACGGDALMRYDAVSDVGGYLEDLIAGEEPELCLRLRQAGFQIWRLDHEMTLHDANITRFSQWWRRTRRAGFAFAQGAALHGAAPERHWVAETRRAVLWGLALPILALLSAAIVSLWFWLLFLAYPLQVFRLRPRMGLSAAIFSVLGKFAEALGILQYVWTSVRGNSARIIEYK